MSSRYFVLALLVVLAGTVPAHGQSTLTYQQALEIARERAPRVAIARARIDEARGRLTGAQIRYRDNPIIDASVGPRWLDTNVVTDFDIGVGQMYELGGRRAARIDAAEAGVAREMAISDAAARQVVRDVAVSFIRTLQSQTRLEVLRSVESLAKEAFDTADRRFRAGDVAILDVNLARTALARATSQTRAAEAQRATEIGELRVLLAWTDQTDPVVVGSLNDRIQDATSESPLTERPEIRSIAAEIAEARADIRLGEGLKKPDLGWNVRAKRDEGNPAAMGGFSVVVPLFNKGQEQIATGLARERRAGLERAAVENQLALRARAAQSTFQLRLDAIEPLEREVLPGLEDNERLARRSFEVGELSLPELLVIRREFVEGRLQYVDALADAAVASVEWQAAAGVLR
jgi:outer membrane protein, heavy metal efflux system